MAPTCKPFGPWSNLNRVRNHAGWLRSYQEAAPHGRFRGRVALIQMKIGRYFINEQPFPSYLYDEPPWPTVVKDPSVVHTVIHQCMTGQVGPNGNLVKKPTGFVANHRLLRSGLFKFICDGSHQHDQLEDGDATRKAQVWTWTLARGVADGISALTKDLLRPAPKSTCPAENGSGPGDATADEVAAAAEPWRKCHGCRRRRVHTDPTHSRVPGECKHPFAESIEYECPGCRKH